MNPGTNVVRGAETASGKKEAEPGHTILVVDDEEDALFSARSLLEREGHRVFTASNGEDALDLFKNRDIHLMVIDYVMPGMNGEELIRRIREVDPYVQILLQTAFTEQAPPRQMLADLDIQGYHDKTDGSRRFLLWVQAGLRAYRTIARLRERERQQSEMVAQASHEIKNPIGLIRGFTELLLDGNFGEIPPPAQTPLRSLGATVQNLNELVGNFLLYAKTQAGAMQVDRRWVSAREVVDDACNHARFLLACKTLDFSVEVQDPLDTFFTDASKVQAILRNLLGNAVKFTPRGSISFRSGPRGRRRSLLGQRHGPGDRSHAAGARLRTVPAARRLHHPNLRRDRPRSGPLAQARSHARRRPARRERGRRGLDVHPSPAGRRRGVRSGRTSPRARQAFAPPRRLAANTRGVAATPGLGLTPTCHAPPKQGPALLPGLGPAPSPPGSDPFPRLPTTNVVPESRRHMKIIRPRDSWTAESGESYEQTPPRRSRRREREP